MTPYYEEEGVTLYHMNCLDALAAMPEHSIETVITDPPYGLSFMGKAWDHGIPGCEFWSAILRVAKPGATLLAFGGTRTYHRLACAIEDAGWELRDCLMWLYGSGFPKSLDISKAIDKAAGAVREDLGPNPNKIGTTRDMRGGRLVGNVTADMEAICRLTIPCTDAAKLWNGWGTALKPAWEPILVAMKPLDGTFAENAQQWGVAGLNIDGGRINPDEVRIHKGHMSSLGVMHDDQWRSTPSDKKTYSGRWPANVLLDEEAAALLDEQSGDLITGDVKPYISKADGFLAGVAGKRTGTFTGDSGGASRFFYVAKASGDERLDNDHPTVKPLTLMKYLCLLTKTPTGGVVLDPFCGSGSTIVAAKEMGRRAIGIDLEEKHVSIAVKRLAQGVLPL